jgi:hypothetical protein
MDLDDLQIDVSAEELGMQFNLMGMGNVGFIVHSHMYQKT